MIFFHKKELCVKPLFSALIFQAIIREERNVVKEDKNFTVKKYKRVPKWLSVIIINGSKLTIIFLDKEFFSKHPVFKTLREMNEI